MPVVYTDFLSMYPTVNSLMGLWRFVIAREISIVEHCEKEVLEFLSKLKEKPEDLFKPETWERMPAFVKVMPDGDILPCRSKYSVTSRDWQVGVNHLQSESRQSRPRAMVYASRCNCFCSFDRKDSQNSRCVSA